MSSMFLQDFELLNLGDRPEKLIVTEIAVPPEAVAKPTPAVRGGSRRRLLPPATLPLFFLGGLGGLRGRARWGGLQPPAPPVAPPLI
jgi:hypothetical protein